MFKNIQWFIERIFILVIGNCLSIFIKRDKNIWLLGAKVPESEHDLFLNHTKYLFLYLNNNDFGIKAIMLFDDKKMLQELKDKGYKNVYLRNSIKGFYYTLKAKYWFFDFGINTVSKWNWKNSGIVPIHMWHGAGGLKKVGYDAAADNEHLGKNIAKDIRTKESFKEKIYKFFKIEDYYYIVNSEYEAKCRVSAFGAPEDKIKITGSPRLDVLFNDIKNAEVFMGKDFNKIKQLKAEGKKIFIYMPTFRDTGENFTKWLQNNDFLKYLKDNNAILICKLHPFDKTPLNTNTESCLYKMDNGSDVYPILKYTDALITDYSSVYFDYLLLDRPILYYIPDLNEYTTQCRGFYEPYENLTAGIYAKDEDELLQGLTDIINNVDNYKEKRKALRDRMFVYKDSNNCMRDVEFVKGLERQC